MAQGQLSTPRDKKCRGATNFLPGPCLGVQTPEVYLPLFVDDTHIYTTDRKEGYVLRKLQRGLTSMESWCERWNMKIDEAKTQTINFPTDKDPWRLTLY
jgi:hypothetical protein